MMRKFRQLILLSQLFVLLFGIAQPLYAIDVDNDKLRGVLFPLYSSNDPTCSILEGGVKLPDSVPEPHKSLFEQAAAAYETNPAYIAALFLSEHRNNWIPFDSQWAQSPKGASGPFQFMPGTWEGYKVDGNNDGQMDVMNIYDAAFAAANMAAANGITTGTPLGDINTPFARGTLIFQSAVYNWGGGNVSSKTTDGSPLSVAPAETQNYMQNVYALITSGFSQGGGNYPAPTRNPSPANASMPTQCSSGVVAGSIVTTALNLAWETGGHGPGRDDATPEYQVAMPQYNNSQGEQPYSDCGVFVATVMVATGADLNYPKRGTSVQENYVRSNPEKYTIIEDVSDTSQLLPGDILLFSEGGGIGHTLIYVGQQAGFEGDAASASLRSHVPEAVSAIGSITYGGRAGGYMIARLK